MNATEFSQKLTILNACKEAIEWSAGKDLATAWATCENGNWMLWLAAKCGVELRALTAAKAACAEFARPCITDLRSIAALDTAHAFGRGECGADELAAAADAAYTAVAPYAAAAATYAANSAYNAATAADAAAAYAGLAARAATKDTTAGELARNETLRKCADEVRKHISVEMLTL